MPLMVAAGAGGESASKAVFGDTLFHGKLAMTNFRFG